MTSFYMDGVLMEEVDIKIIEKGQKADKTNASFIKLLSVSLVDRFNLRSKDEIIINFI